MEYKKVWKKAACLVAGLAVFGLADNPISSYHYLADPSCASDGDTFYILTDVDDYNNQTNWNYDIVGLYAFTVPVAVAQIVLGAGVAGLGGLCIKADGFLYIFCHAAALLVAVGEIVLGLGIPLFRSDRIPADSFPDIPGNPLPDFITVAYLTLGSRVAAVSRHLQPPGCLCYISADADPFIVTYTHLILRFYEALIGRLAEKGKSFPGVGLSVLSAEPPLTLQIERLPLAELLLFALIPALL